jgi:putative acetyltransferase
VNAGEDDAPRRWRLRTARPEDAEELAALHRASILRAAPGSYGPTQIRAWLEPLVPEVYPKIMEQARMRVAVEDGVLCGFSTTAVEDTLLRALYVAPFAMGQGVGGKLLADAEEALLSAGRTRLDVHATLNAVEFYRWHGFVDVKETSNRLPNGVALACLGMRKQLR